MKNDRILSLVGLAKRGRNVVSGEFATEKAIKTGAACLVIVATDASDNTKKLFTDKCSFYEVPIFFYSDKEEIGRALGCQSRASLAVTDEGLANAITKKFE